MAWRSSSVDSDGAFLGLFSNNTKDPSSSAAAAVAVEFDTYKNHGLDPPNVTADHIGIDVDNITSANYTALPNVALSGVMSASIRYDGGSKVMSVSLWLADASLYTVQARVDLKDALAGPDAAVGFSAATGTQVESHQLLCRSFSSTGNHVPRATLVYLRVRSNSKQKKKEISVARKFRYKQLSQATKHFSQDKLLGAGSFGEVYQGDLRDDPSMRLVAVKKLKQHAEQFRKDYVSEIEILGQLNHRNLVKLVGWCDGGAGKQLLVYELVNNGSVDEHLHGSGRPPLGWPERYKIVLGVGRAIEYLHTGCHNNLVVLHRDINSAGRGVRGPAR
ncbi:hypothetical protein HU200_009388 [Digitaria exilis]|uniref:non-specific serine/threonine protein kinase n=1 Tax=Digitaria exilis TaxID=1010633 RepID=A0A835FJ27_9POAL|nr:hypothetical protein HU200_009388 [Digitaria exilis]